ncbi:MFS transporter [uncultured Sanguibacteroides sp.]|uniref:MFS transporter n=1 Tax=uncultured Sanguibacteroides sp. TaxID=1635151 RepID=UPI0025ECFCAF|nr:MFS transporter [uncultured Sanguibacteroides sp.]
MKSKDYLREKMTKDIIISVCVFLSGFSCFAQLYYFQPLLPDLAKEFSLTASHSSFAISFSTLGMVIGLFTAMFIADRIPRKQLISWALLSSSIFSVISSFSTSFFFLVLLSAAKGFLLSGATSVSLAYISEEVLPQNKGKITGLYIAGNALGGMAGRVISSYISEEYSWRIASVSIGILCAFFALLFLFFSPRSTNFTPKKENFKSLITENLKFITIKELVPFYIIGSLMLGIFVSLYNYLGFYLVKEPFNFSPYLIHYIYLMYLFGIFGSVATAKLTYYFDPVQVLKTTILISIPGIGLMYITNFWIVTLGLAILTFDFFVIHVICNRIVSEYNVMKRSVTISIYLLAYYLGSSFWGSATGVVLDTWGWQYFLAGLVVLLLVLYLFAKQGEKVMQKK